MAQLKVTFAYKTVIHIVVPQSMADKIEVACRLAPGFSDIFLKEYNGINEYTVFFKSVRDKDDFLKELRTM